MVGKATKAFGALVVLALGVAGCGDDDDGGSATPASSTSAPPDATATSTASTAAPDPGCTAERAGGELTIATMITPAGLDPVASPASGLSGGWELAAIYDTLMRWNPETGEHEPRMAESLTPNADASEWTLELRPDVTFSDGTPVTAEAAKASMEMHQKEPRSRASGLARNVASMRVVDDRTLVYVLTEPWGSFPYLLANEPGMVVNPAAIVAKGGREAFATDPDGGGAGPYEVVRFAPGEEVVMEARDDYWGGPVCIERLTFRPVAGATATYDAFRNGEVDFAVSREPKVSNEVEDDGVAHQIEYDSAGSVLLLNNGGRGGTPATADIRVRQAVLHAIDPEAVNTRLHDGTGSPTSAVIGEESRYFDGLQGPTFDPDQARSLVAAVRAEGSWDGHVSLLTTNTPTATDLSVLVEGMLEAVGFEVDVESVSATSGEVLQRVIVNANYEIAAWGLGIRDASPWVTLYNNLAAGIPSNYAGYADPDMDVALAALKAAGDLDEQQAALAEIQDVWNETAPLAIYENSANVMYWREGVKGIEFSQNVIAHFGNAYLDD